MSEAEKKEPKSDNDEAKSGGNGGPPHFQIRIDRDHYTVAESTLTGAQLRALPDPDIGGDRDLFEVVPGGSDIKIEQGMVVEMRSGLRLFTAPAQINPGS